MITTTLGRLVDAVPTLQRLAQLPLGIRAAYDLAKLTKLIDVETSLFADRVHALRAQHGAPGPQDVVPVDRRDAFHAALAELVTIAVDVPWKPFDLTACASLTLAAADLHALGLEEPWALATVPAEVTNTAETTEEKSI